MMVYPHRQADDLSELVRFIRVEIPTASDDLILPYVKRAVVEFCESSQFWVEEVGPIQVIPGIDTYEIATSAHQALVNIRDVYTEHQDKLLQLGKGREAVDWRWWMHSPDSIVISPVDRMEGKTLNVIAAVKPKERDGVFRVSEHVINDYFEALCWGAKSKLYRVPTLEIADVSMAAMYEHKFNEVAEGALRRVANGYSRSPKRVPPKPRDFF